MAIQQLTQTEKDQLHLIDVYVKEHALLMGPNGDDYATIKNHYAQINEDVGGIKADMTIVKSDVAQIKIHLNGNPEIGSQGINQRIGALEKKDRFQQGVGATILVSVFSFGAAIFDGIISVKDWVKHLIR